MTSKLPWEKIHKKIFKSCFKFVFLTKKFKEKNSRHFLETFSKMIKNTEIHNIIDIIAISKSMEPNNFI
jgi:hypothetical protein